MRVAVLRLKHVQRSMPTSLHSYTLQGYCFRRKTATSKGRTGYEWSCPRYDEAGNDVDKWIWQHWLQLSKAMLSPALFMLRVIG